MQQVGARRVELGVDAAAAALLAGASGHFLLVAGGETALAASVAALAFAASFKALRSVARAEQRMTITPIDIGQLFRHETAELVLTDADRVAREPAQDDELLLDDIIEQLGPEARVVRLFDRAAMPTPGQMKARIDRHLDVGSPQTAPPDASQDLYQALANLRRSLR